MPLFETPTEPSTPPSETGQQPPVVVVAGRHGEWDTHELIRLLDTIEDERARGRFRESLYISIFVWIAIAWFIFYGPRMLWHAPELRDPASVLREREMTSITLPTTHLPPVVKTTPPPRPTIDKSTMERLRKMSPPAPEPAPAPATAPPPPAPVAAAPPPPTPPVASPKLPQPVADAPTMQPTKPNFGRPSSAGDNIRDALNGAARSHGSGIGDLSRPAAARNTPLNLGGVEVLSDLQGVDFDAYLKRVYYDVYRNWLPLIPQETLPPLSKEGQTWITFTILPDGRIGEMHLDGSTHDEAINRSAWGSITTEGQFPPLPSQFHGPNLMLRFHYIVSKQPPE